MFENRLHSKLSNILEYTISFSILGFFLLFAYDLRKYQLAYVRVEVSGNDQRKKIGNY